MKTLDRLAYTPTEAAEVASVSRPTIYRWMHLEGFPVARIGGCTRIPAEAFKQWINQQAEVTESA
nr:helix-turn-helix domain-containing protein [uncultured Dysosmobacter sp.]